MDSVASSPSPPVIHLFNYSFKQNLCESSIAGVFHEINETQKYHFAFVVSKDHMCWGWERKNKNVLGYQKIGPW